MDNRTIFSKTGKGSLEISKKSLKLSSEERQALILVDGKSTLEQLEEKLNRVPPVKLRAIFEHLLAFDLIREFITKAGPDSVMAVPGSAAAAMRVVEVTEDDLDFTAFAAVVKNNPVQETAAQRQAAETAATQAREQEAKRKAEALVREAAARKALEDAARKVQEEAQSRERARLAEEAKRKVLEEATRKAREEAARKTQEVAARQAREDAERQAREEAARKTQEDAARQAREEAERQAREEAARKAQEVAARLAREEAERKAREEAARKAQEEAARQAREEAARKAQEEAARLAREEAERLAREEAERQAREEAERKARDEAARKTQEEAARQAREDAERKAREEAARKAQEEVARQAREDAERKAREEAARKAQEEAARLAREDASRKAQEVIARATQAAAESKAREAAERETREEAERAARAHAEARERARVEEEAKRLEIAERAKREEAEQQARERARQEEESVRREIAARQATETSEEQRRADEEAARYTKALTPHLEAAVAPDLPANGPAPMGAFANLSALEANTSGARHSTSAELPANLEGADSARIAHETQSRKQDEKAAKERAKQEARARKEAAKEARNLAKEEAASSGRGRSIGAGKIIAAVLMLVIGGAVAYVFTLSADKPAIEKMLSARLGAQVTVGEAKFTPFPAELRLTNVAFGDIKLPLVVASADPASLASNDKIWRNVDITGLDLNPAQVERLAALANAEPTRAAVQGFTLQRVRALAVNISGTPVAVPKFDATLLLGPGGALKQATFALPDGRAQVLLAADEKGWLVDIESRGMVWPLGPKLTWDSVRAKGIATRAGLKFDELALTAGSGGVRGTGELTWSAGWKYSGTIDVSGIDAETIGNAIFAATPVSGPFEGKLEVSMASPTLARLFEAPQIDGSFVMSKVVFKTVDFARLLQGNDPGAGQTRLPELTGNLSASAGRLQLRQLRGSSGLLSIAGALDVLPDKSLSGTVSIELGASGSRGRTNLKISGSVTEPRFGR